MKRKARLEAQAGTRVRKRMYRQELERLKAPVVRRRRKRGCRASGRSGDEMEVGGNLLENQVESKLIAHNSMLCQCTFLKYLIMWDFRVVSTV